MSAPEPPGSTDKAPLKPRRRRTSHPVAPAFPLIVEAYPSAILVVDGAGRIVYSNPEAANLLGYPREQLEQMTVDTLVPDGIEPIHRAHRAAYMADPTPRMMGAGRNLYARGQDGTLLPVDVGLRSYTYRGRTFVIAALADRTAQEAERDAHHRYIEVLSHELRTPVTTLYGGAVMLQQRRSSLRQSVVSELIDGMAMEATRLQRIIDNLVVLARVERGVASYPTEPLLLGHLLPAFVTREQRVMPAMKVRLRVQRGLPIVRGQQDAVELILHNLLSNAVKYGGRKPVDLEAVKAEDGGVDVRVSDRGRGMAPEEVDRLFELYYRGTANRSVAQGSGIGLFVAKELATALGGFLRAANRPDGGAVFTLTLKPYDAAGDAGDHEPAAPEPPRRRPRHG